MIFIPKSLSLIALFIALSFSFLRADEYVPDPTIPWAEIREIARSYVAEESSAEVWPFAHVPFNDRTENSKKVFAHFFVPFPLSFENAPSEVDHYARHYLSPEGEGGKFSRHGGFLRQRPLPVGPWKSPWWQQINLAIEIYRAQAIGLDGFAVNILGIEPNRGARTWERVLMLMETASAVAPDFSIMLMPDMNAGLKRNPERLESVIQTLARYPVAYRLDDGRLVISPFKGNAQPPSYWEKAFKALEAEGLTTAFLPVFLGYQNIDRFARDYGYLCYGMSDWGFRDIAQARSFDFENAREKVIEHTPVWMMPVAPQDARPKNMFAWEAENTSAFRYLWEIAREGDSQYVHMITWNDYGEATEISPSSGTQYLFYDLSAYFITWFKEGKPPAITSDAIYYSHRIQTVPLREGPDLEKQDGLFKQMGHTPFKNEVELLAMLTMPAVLEIEQNGRVTSAPYEAGLVSLKAPAEAGTPLFRIVRDGKIVVEIESQWKIVDEAEFENPLYFGGSSTRN